MKLSRLESTTQQHSPEAVERASHAQAQQIRRVEAMEGVVADRQRSLQQELADIDPRAQGPFAGGERILEDTRQLAAQLSELGSESNRLIKPVAGKDQLFTRIDASA